MFAAYRSLNIFLFERTKSLFSKVLTRTLGNSSLLLNTASSPATGSWSCYLESMQFVHNIDSSDVICFVLSQGLNAAT